VIAREATPLPTAFQPNEIGLMTSEEFLRFRNPSGKSHSSDAYDSTLSELNRDYPRPIGTAGGYGDAEVTVAKLSDGYRVQRGNDVIAVIHDGVAYYDKPHLKRLIPKSVWQRETDKETDLGITSYKQVKYLAEVAGLISPVAQRNELEYPVILQRIVVRDESMTVRAEKPLVMDAGTTIVILNSNGWRVASAQDEWGATLLMVAQEYRGSGLGKIVGKYWYEHNPSYTSGGFTEAGKRNALAIWRGRVREFVALGWYSELVRQGRLTHSRVKEILAGSEESPKSPDPPKVLQTTGDILVYADDITFVVYDRAFLENPDENLIHGYGFFRGDTKKSFIYRIEYDRPFADMTTRVALQIAKDGGETLYDGGGANDMLELDGVPGIVRTGDFIRVTEDLIDVKTLAAKEKRLRKAADPYGDKYNLLLEMAESKWS